MITTKKEFDIVVEMYRELREMGNGVQCDHGVGICACGLYDMLEDARKMIEKSAAYLGYIEKKGKNKWGISKKKKVE